MIRKLKIQHIWLSAMFLLVSAIPGVGWTETVNYELTIAQKKVTISGTTAEGMTLNGSIPGPTLRFKEGDTARIQVHNRMSVATSIHWHGLLVPPNMDGVPYVSFPPIQPGATFTYEFPIRQSGTYWYHSHSNLQEQSGVYGSIVIEPQHGDRRADSDHVILLSDWTTEDPHSVLRSLKRGSEWYALDKGSSQSILGAAIVGKLGDYFVRELQRMPAMDIADVAYDYFLANGQPETNIKATGGETVRLRIINGSATTYFHLEYAGGPMKIIAADGLDVQPIAQQRFLISVAETYDVLVKIPQNGAYEFRATAQDASGYASVWLGGGQRYPAPDIPQPNLYQNVSRGNQAPIWALTPNGTMGMPDDKIVSGKFDQPGMMGMQGMSMTQGLDDTASSVSMSMPSKKEPAPDRHEMAGAIMNKTPEMDTMKKTGHGTPDMPSAQHQKRKGKKYAKDFRFLAADVSSRKDLAADGMDPRRPWAPYAKLRALEPTSFETDKPIREIRLTLDGDMERYVWFLNNKALSESDVIRIRAG
ncbi:MAG: copper oxidase, partial [Deltaproteobacteria bacterium]